VGRGIAAVEGSDPNIGFNIKVAKPLMFKFNKKASKVAGFIIAYRLYLRMRIRGVLVEE